MHDSTPTYSEQVSFDNGEHVTIGAASPDTVTVIGRLNGEEVTAILNCRDANYQAGLLCSYAPDALWQMPWDRMERAGNALHAAAVHAAFPGPDNDATATDSSEDVTTQTVPLDGGTAIVEHTGGRVEVTIRLGARTVAAVTLSPTEAHALGRAVSRPGGFTVADYWGICDQLGTSNAA